MLLSCCRGTSRPCWISLASQTLVWLNGTLLQQKPKVIHPSAIICILYKLAGSILDRIESAMCLYQYAADVAQYTEHAGNFRAPGGKNNSLWFREYAPGFFVRLAENMQRASDTIM